MSELHSAMGLMEDSMMRQIYIFQERPDDAKLLIGSGQKYFITYGFARGAGSSNWLDQTDSRMVFFTDYFLYHVTHIHKAIPSL